MAFAILALLTAFLGAFLIVLGGPKRAGALYPAALLRVRPELKLALGLAVTAGACIAAGASFSCIALLQRSPRASQGAMNALLLVGVAALGLGPLTCELIWAWIIGPVAAERSFKEFLRWNDHTRFGVMMALRWTGAFLIFFLSFRKPGAWDILVPGMGLIVYGIMLGFVDAAALRGLRRPLQDLVQD